MFFPISEWLPAFLVTLAVELPVAAYLLRRAEPDLPRRLLLVVFANLLTHPSVWFVFTQLFLIGTLEYTVAAEAWAIGIEALFYVVTIRGLGPRRALAVALAANLASFAAGRLVTALGWEILS
jgi:hypothetical protein